MTEGITECGKCGIMALGTYCEKCYNKTKEEAYKEGFRDGLEACKPSKKLDKAIKEGIEV